MGCKAVVGGYRGCYATSVLLPRKTGARLEVALENSPEAADGRSSRRRIRFLSAPARKDYIRQRHVRLCTRAIGFSRERESERESGYRQYVFLFRMARGMVEAIKLMIMWVWMGSCRSFGARICDDLMTVCL